MGHGPVPDATTITDAHLQQYADEVQAKCSDPRLARAICDDLCNRLPMPAHVQQGLRAAMYRFVSTEHLTATELQKLAVELDLMPPFAVWFDHLHDHDYREGAHE